MESIKKYFESFKQTPDEMELNIKNLQNDIQTSQQKIDLNNKLIKQKNEELEAKLKILKQQEHNIKNKQKLVLTRNRMLQLSQEKNIYKKKVMYSLISLVILLLIILIAIYIFYSNKL